jgi:predicted HAD superfamily Cof-like phosphohydrolase
MNTKDDVANFMRAADQAVFEDLQAFNQQSLLYGDLVKEEFYELMYALKEMNLVETADACADLIWVIEGLCHSLGIPLQKVWDEVARSNMSKTVNGKLVKREDGKVLKPDTYSAPDINKILYNKE